MASLFDAVHEAIIGLDETGSVVLMNRPAENLTQWTAEEATGKQLSEVAALYQDGQLSFTDLNGFSEPGPVTTGCAVLRSRAGVEIPVWFNLVRAAEEFRGFVVSFHPQFGAPVRRTESAAPMATGPVADAIISLGSRAAAEQAVGRVVEADQRSYASVFAPARLAVYQGRYGTAGVAKIKSAFAQHLSEQLTAGDDIYDWTSTSLLAILTRDKPMEEVLHQVRSIAARKVDITLRGGIVSLTAEVRLLPLFGDKSAEDLVAELDQLAN